MRDWQIAVVDSYGVTNLCEDDDGKGNDEDDEDEDEVGGFLASGDLL